jgi:SAM-dependent methyltransferase
LPTSLTALKTGDAMGTMDSFWDERWRGGQGVHPKHINALSLLRPQDRGRLIGDFGCGPGVFLGLLKDAGFPVESLWGVDVSAQACAAVEAKGLNSFHGTFAEFPKHVEIAVLIDVLEHVFDPDAFFEWLVGAADEAILAVPNFSSWTQRLQMLGGQVPYQNKVGRGGHVFFTNDPIMRKYFKRHGYIVQNHSHLFAGKSRGALGRFTASLQALRAPLFATGLAYRVKRA